MFSMNDRLHAQALAALDTSDAVDPLPVPAAANGAQILLRT